jgi:hypothetical protein
MDIVADGKADGPDRTLAVVLAIAAVLIALVAAGVYFEVARRNSSLKVAFAIEEVRKVKRQTRAYLEATSAFPEGNKDLDLPEGAAKNYSDILSRPDVLSYTMMVQRGTITFIFGPDQGALAGRSIQYSPVFSEKKLRWTCASTVPNKHLPPKCRT